MLLKAQLRVSNVAKCSNCVFVAKACVWLLRTFITELDCESFFVSVSTGFCSSTKINDEISSVPMFVFRIICLKLAIWLAIAQKLCSVYLIKVTLLNHNSAARIVKHFNTKEICSVTVLEFRVISKYIYMYKLISGRIAPIIKSAKVDFVHYHYCEDT